MDDLETRRFARPSTDPSVVDRGLADVFSLHRSRRVAADGRAEREFFFDTLAEYQWARDAAGLMPNTIDLLVKPVIEVCDHYGVVAWQLKPRDLDRYFAGPGKRARATVRSKISKSDLYFAFLEQRYAGEIARLFGASVDSPVDPFNRPRHRGDFGLRVPPSQRAMREFLATWRDALPRARKEAVACRDYVMTKIAYLSGVRAAELCGLRIADVHWEAGQWGRFLVRGKGARGSGPREREAFLFEQGRELLWWYIEEVRGMFRDDPEHPAAPLFPSERLPAPVAALNMPVAPGVVPATFRRALKSASRSYLPGPVRELFPHLLRHACATHNFERGMSLWEVQRLLGHEWTTTTVRYLARAGRPGAARAISGGGAGGTAVDGRPGEFAVKWNLRWAAARQDIWRPTDLLAAFRRVGFTPSLSKVAALWGGTPVTVRLDDLDRICAALNCTVADLLEAQPVAVADGEREVGRAVGAELAPATRPVARLEGPRRLRPPN